jgi:hypothetical protein
LRETRPLRLTPEAGPLRPTEARPLRPTLEATPLSARLILPGASPALPAASLALPGDKCASWTSRRCWASRELPVDGPTDRRQADAHAERRREALETRKPGTTRAADLSPRLQRSRSSDGKPSAERRAARGPSTADGAAAAFSTPARGNRQRRTARATGAALTASPEGIRAPGISASRCQAKRHIRFRREFEELCLFRSL